MLRKKFLAVAMSAVLAVSLCPGLAVAAPLGAGDIAADKATPAKTVSTQASKTTVNVLTGYTVTTTRANSDGTKSTSGPYTYGNVYEYNKSGLLTSNGSYNFKYSGANLKSAAPAYPSTYSTYKYAFKSKKGLVQSCKYTYTPKSEGSSKYGSDKADYKFSYDKKGNLTKSVETDYAWNYGNKYFKKLTKTGTVTRNYTLNKKGLATKAVTESKWINKSYDVSAPRSYKYDKKKNLTSTAASGYSNPTTYKTTYKKNVPVTRTVTQKSTYRDWETGKVSTTTTTTTYKLTYKAVKTSKAFAAVAQRQQWSLLNNSNQNGAFGQMNISDLDGYYYYDD